MTERESTVEMLCSKLIQIDTTNPGSCERLAAEYVCEVLTGLGLSPRILEGTVNRSNVVARVVGERSDLQALLVQAHLDTVPVESSEWSVGPFSGEIADGYIWGRGAVDMKNAIAMTLASLTRMRERGEVPLRDLLLVFTADEEQGGIHGAKYLVNEHADLFEGCGVSIGEVGGFNLPQSAGPPHFLVSTADKGIRNYSVRSTGTSGHGSMISSDNALLSLARDLLALAAAENQVHITDPMRAFVQALDPDHSDTPAEALDALLRTGSISRMLIPGLRNTINVTQIGGGYKTNVIPGEAWATIDCRFLPGYEEELHQLLLASLSPSSRITLDRHSPAAVSDSGGMWFDWMAAALRNAIPDILVSPYVFSGSTDNKWFGTLGIPTYGFTPMLLPPDYDFSAMFHGADERVPVEALEFGVDVLCDLFVS